jgi:uncharacterized protein with NAD-binding domain and iron-sulfur cluster
VAVNAKQRIAVLGGGIGALSAAFYITEQPGWADKYEITVYQQGWRLGGKCASGHDMREGYGHRIYEHGLHIFAGFYYQAFDLLRRAYRVVDRPDGHPNQDVWDAFTPEDNVTLVDRSDPGNPNLMWYVDMPPNDEVPGDDLKTASLADMIQGLVALLIHFSPGAHDRKAPEAPIERRAVDPNQAGAAATHSWAPASLLHDAIALFKGFVGGVGHVVEGKLEDLTADFVLHQMIGMIEEHARSIRDMKTDTNALIPVERFLLSAYLVQTIIHGVAADNVLEKGYDSIDVYEFSEWLFANAVAVAKNFPEWGDPAKRATELINWTPITSAYDYVFGYGDGGDTSMRSFAAGTALRSFNLLALGYKGHFFWKMRGAMGDVVIAPLYLALLKRGVKFQFLSRVTALNPDPAIARIASIDYVQQAQLKHPEQGYQPLIEVPAPGWPADAPLEGWPAEPLWDQIADGDALRAAGRDFEADNNDAPGPGDVARQLRFGADFDKVVIGISVGGLKQVCASFPARVPQSNWGPMFNALTLTRTCAMQLWLTRTMDDLGCKGSDRTLAGADQPYSAWSDMSHLLSRETWNGATRPRAIAYFCGQLPGPENGRPADRKAYDAAVSWLRANSQIYWSRATSPTSPYALDPKLIFDPEPGAPGDVLTRQYIRANCNPSDLYVQSPKNSVYTRMDANQSGFDNLFLTGDWTLNGLNSGCAEAAARSGARCAQAIAGALPPLDD